MKRIQLTKNPYSKKPKANFVKMMKADFNELMKFICNKMKLNSKTARIFVVANCPSAKQGTEIKSETDLSILVDDILLYATNGKDYKESTINKDTKKYQEIIGTLTKPPCYSFLIKIKNGGEKSENIESKESEEQSNVVEEDKQEDNEKEFEISTKNEKKNSFPIFDGPVLSIIKNAIKECPNITETIFEDYTVFDYKEEVNYSSDPEKASIQKECRG